MAAHKVTPAEFEQLLNNDLLDLAYEVIGSEERWRSVGITDGDEKADQTRRTGFRYRGGRSGMVSIP